MIKFTVNGDPVEIPTCYAEVDYRTYLKVFDAKDDPVKKLSIFLHQDYEILKKARIKGLNNVLRALSFLEHDPQVDDSPRALHGFALPTDATMESLEQFQTAKDLIDKADTTKADQFLALLSKITAVYIQPAVDSGDFDATRVEEVNETVLSYPCEEVLSAGRFFFIKLWSIMRGTSEDSLRVLATQTRKSRRVLKPSTRRSDSMPRSTRLRATRGKRRRKS